jgi:predicted Zn-dependent protease
VTNNPRLIRIHSNKVFFFSGILPICEDEVGIATVLSHEISHNLAHHAAEQLSSSGIRWLIVVALAAFGYLDYSGLLFLDLAFTKPRSRRQETEADQIGLSLMSLSCYDPRAAIPFWQRMQRADNVRVPEFISTHPSNDTRIEQFKGWMDDALTKYDSAGCARSRTVLADFNNTSSRWMDF